MRKKIKRQIEKWEKGKRDEENTGIGNQEMGTPMRTTMTGAGLLARAYPKRAEWSFKGDHGKVLVVGGSAEYTGSPIFNCMAAYAAGADLVTLLAPKRAANVAANFAPEIIAPPLQGDFLRPAHVKTIICFAKKADAMVIGGGLGRKPKTKDAFFEIMEKTEIPAVVDADALRFAAGEPEKMIGRKKMLLTPHAGELAALAGVKKISSDVEERVKISKSMAKKFGSVVFLKGAIDVVTDGSKTAFDCEGSPYLTKGGVGDVAAGVCGALLARGLSPFDAAATAAYMVGKAGKNAAKERGESLLPTEIIGKIARIIPKSH
jgi:NAD(P)H-hydrate epimerase